MNLTNGLLIASLVLVAIDLALAVRELVKRRKARKEEEFPLE